MNIVYFYNEEWEKDYVAARLPDNNFEFIQGVVQDHADVVRPDAEVLSIFVNSRVDAATFERFPNLKLIAARSTGFDHIDLAEAQRRNVQVVNVPTYGEHTVAEFAMALLLALSRRVYDAYKQVETTGSFEQNNLRGFDLKGRIIGVVGTGHIGQHMITMAKGFAMNVIGYDPFPKQGLDQTLGFTYVGLEELLNRSDVITLHAPYNEHTHHLINNDNVSRIKRGAFVINTARGGLIETSALVRGLEEGIIAGAGLDVLEEEGQMKDEASLLFAQHPNSDQLRTLLANHYFIKHPRVIVTPHVAFDTQEAIERILNTTIDNISKYREGQVQNKVG